MKKTNDPVELTDEEMGKASGGMKIVVTKDPKFFSPLLRLIFKIKNRSASKADTDTVITGPVIAEENALKDVVGGSIAPHGIPDLKPGQKDESVPSGKGDNPPYET